jgi:hypothetical protein
MVILLFSDYAGIARRVVLSVVMGMTDPLMNSGKKLADPDSARVVTLPIPAR